MSVIFSVRVDEQTAGALRQMAQDQGVSTTELLREAVQRMLQQECALSKKELLRRLVRLEATLMKAGAGGPDLLAALEPCFRQLTELIDLLRDDIPRLQKKCA